jgi:hypothetical protein
MHEFWRKVDRGDTDECWEWQASVAGGGYGHYIYEGEDYRAHRFAYELEHEDPQDKLVLHRCDNRVCVNPDHLYLGDYTDNLNDAYERTRDPLKGEENPATSLSEQEVGEIKWLLENTDETQEQIAKLYPAGQSTISHISSGKTWADVDPKKPLPLFSASSSNL